MRRGRRHDQERRHTHEHGKWRKIGDRVVRQGFEQGCIDRERRIAADEDGVAVGGRCKQGLDCDKPVGPWFVLNDDALTSDFGQLLAVVAS